MTEELITHAPADYTPAQLKKLETSIDEGIRLILEFRNDLQKLGDFIALQVAQFPDYLERLADKEPDIPEEFVRRLLLVGLKRLHPELVINESSAARYLRRFPRQLQDKCIVELIPTLIQSSTGWETLNIDFRNLTPAQARQVFAPDRVRSEPEQRAWLESEREKRAVPPADGVPYQIRGNTLIINQLCRFERRELADILAKMS